MSYESRINEKNNFTYFPQEEKLVKKLAKYQLLSLVILLTSLMVFSTIFVVRLLDNEIYFDHLFLRIFFSISIGFFLVSISLLILPKKFFLRKKTIK